MERYKTLQGINIALYYIRTLQGIDIALYIILERYKTLQVINIALYYIRTLQNATRFNILPLLYYGAASFNYISFS